MLNALCQFLTLFVVAKLGTVAQVGHYGLALSVVSPVFMLAALRMRTILATDSGHRFPFVHFLQLRLVAMLFALVVVIAMTRMGAWHPLAWLFLCVAIGKAIESVSEILQGLQQKYERVDLLSLSLVASGVAGLLCFALGFYATRDLIVATAAVIAARLLVLFAYDLPATLPLWQQDLVRVAVARASPAAADSTGQTLLLRAAASWDPLGRLFWQALPLGTTSLLVSLNSGMPKYQLSWFATDADVGIFVMLSSVMAAGTMAFRAVEQPVTPRLARYFAAGNFHAFWRLLRSLMWASAVTGAIAAGIAYLAGAWLLNLIRPEYAPHVLSLALLVLATTASYAAGIVEAALIGVRFTGIHLPMHLCTLAACTLCGFLLIPRHGVLGGAIALCLCRLPYIAVGWVYLRRAVPAADV